MKIKSKSRVKLVKSPTTARSASKGGAKTKVLHLVSRKQKELEESFRRSWQEALSGDTIPISQFWEEFDNE